MKPCTRNVNMPDKFVEIHYLSFPIGHTPKRPNCDGTVLVSDPNQIITTSIKGPKSLGFKRL